MARPQRSAVDEAAWTRAAALVDWAQPYRCVWQEGPWEGRWFPGGRIDLLENLVSRHARSTPEAAALAWAGEPGDARTVTFGDLARETTQLIRGLRRLGVRRGDVVALHLGAIPETVVAMVACAGLGATYVVIPTPLPVDGLIERLEVIAPRVLFTQDGAWRRGVVLPLKARVDDALSAVAGVEHTVVVRRTGMSVAWFEGDHWYHELLAPEGSLSGPEPPAELFAIGDRLTLTSLPHRGRGPVTAALGPGSVLAAAALHRGAMADGAVTWVAGEMSWPGTQFHGILGPLALGETQLLVEGTLDEPSPVRAWDLLVRHEVTTFVTVPSILRRMRTWSRELPQVPPVPQLRRVVSVGEPLDAELRGWLERDLAGRPVTTADGWGQIELGGVVGVDHPLDSGYLPDIGMCIVDDEGRLAGEQRPGQLILTRMWAGMMLSAGGDPALLQVHWPRPDGPYVTGDRARRTAAGELEFLGRIDQIVSVSGQLVSLGEVRALLAEHPFTASVDVLERGGLDGSRYVAAAVVVSAAAPQDDRDHLVRELSSSVREILGGLACPKLFLVVDRFGDELRGDERRRALSRVHVPPGESAVVLTWAQVLAAADNAS
ncbi:MAG: AMP-binding protein [Austwickia sp.]|nr:AMP-binding protein [Actinomycetota bacterium]MCB1252048.1 AMP-binding protein [Austwickia sp.]